MRLPATTSLVFILLMPVALVAAATDVDTSQLPAPASQKINFRRDIEPILKDNCLCCHGVERPKSNFRLTTRDLALKGGDNGVDIFPGQSAISPLIHYTARLVPDMEMPPEGKGAPLTPHQVALLRAWIDQSVPWDESSDATNSVLQLEVAPAFGGIIVQGDRGRFREVEAQPVGIGGLQRFRYQLLSPDGRSTTIEAKALRDDYELALDWRVPELGFARFGFDQFRTYYDDAGGYYAPLSPAPHQLGRDLHLDSTRAWAELGLTLPKWPRLVLGYEYRAKDGDKSMLSWGPVQPATGNFLDIRNIYPASKNIDESIHIVRFDIAYDRADFRIENNLRLELYDSSTRRSDALNVPVGAPRPDLLLRIQEQHRWTQLADSLSLQKSLTDWWLGNLGYRYSWLDGDASLRLTPHDGSGQPAAASAWFSDRIVMHELWHLLNVNTQIKPLPEFTATLGAQAQWKRQRTFGDVNLDEVVDPTDPTSGIFRFPATEHSTLDQTTVEEDLLLRYTGLPFTSLYAEAKLEQEHYTRYADQDGGPHAFQLYSDAAVHWRDYRLGFNNSPMPRLSLGGYYRHRERETDYDLATAQRNGAYPGFITTRDIASDELDARTTFRPLTWVKTTLQYRYSQTEYRTTTGSTSPDEFGPDATPGGRIYAGRYNAHTVNAGAVLTLWRKVHLSLTGSYQNSRTTTADHESPSVAPYGGESWTALPSIALPLNDRTDLSLSYVFNRARFGQDNIESGLPLGVDYDRHAVHVALVHRFSNSFSARLQYGYFSYHESSAAGLPDYSAHQVLLVAGLKW
jgi:hypothetical protein